VLGQNVEDEKDAEFVAMEEVDEEQSLGIPIVEQLLDEAGKLNKAIQEPPESPCDTKLEIKVVKSFFTCHISELKDQTMHDSEEIADIYKGCDSDLKSMANDDLRSVSRFHTADSDNTHENKVSKSDHIFQDDNAFAERLSLPDHMDHICEEVGSLHSRLRDMESSIVQQVSAEFKSSLSALVTDSLKEQLPSLLSDALKDTLPQLLRDSIKSSISKSIVEELPHHLLNPEEQQKSLHDFTNQLFGTTSLKFSPTPPREPTPPKDPAKKAKILEEYNHQISFRVDPLPITKIIYTVNSNKEVTMKIIRGDNPLNLIVHPNFRLKSLSFSEWLEAKKLGLSPPPALATFRMTPKEKKRKRTEFLKEAFVTKDIKVDGMNKNLIPPPRVVPIEGLVIKEPESIIFYMNRNTDIVFQRDYCLANLHSEPNQS
nr:hypothetical protein [Tanacetum cinerariifolium]